MSSAARKLEHDLPRPPIFADPKVTEAFEKYGRRDGNPEIARAMVETQPGIAAELGQTAAEYIERGRWTITLEDAVKAGLFEPIDGEDDVFADLRTA